MIFIYFRLSLSSIYSLIILLSAVSLFCSTVVHAESIVDKTAMAESDYSQHGELFYLSRKQRLEGYRPVNSWPRGNWGGINSAVAKVYLGESPDLMDSQPESLHRESVSTLIWPIYARLLLAAWDKSKLFPGRLKSHDQKSLLDYFWGEFSYLLADEKSFEAIPGNTPADTWRAANDSENHFFTKQTTFLLFFQVFKELAPYKTGLINGLTAAKHYELWRVHWHHRFDEYLKNGLLIEAAASSYSKYTLSALLNIIDFAADAELRLKARTLMDMLLANAAIESLPNFSRGGSRSRKSILENILHDSWANIVAKVYLSQKNGLGAFGPNFLTSAYYPSEAIISLWGDASQSGSYEVYGARPGINHTGTKDVNPEESVLRYSYVTPDYILASSMVEAGKHEYSDISAEGRYISLLGNPDPAQNQSLGNTPFVVFGGGGYQCMDKIIAVQDRSVLAFQNNINFYRSNKGAAKRCWGDPKGSYQTQRRPLADGGYVYYKMAESYSAAKADPNRNHVDIAISNGGAKDVKVSQEGSNTFLEFPGSTMYVSVNALSRIECNKNNPFTIREGGFNPKTQSIQRDYLMQDIVLNCDKFAPIAVEVGSKIHYQNFENFKREMKARSDSFTQVDRGGVYSYDYTASLRSSLMASDRFLDSSSVTSQKGAEPIAHFNLSQHTFEDTYFNFGAVSDYVEFEVNIGNAGVYNVFGRFIALDGSTNSVMISVDDDSNQVWHLAKSSNWHWQSFSVSGEVQGFYLEPGLHKIRISTREFNTKLDSLILTQAEKLPDPARVTLVEYNNGSEPYPKKNNISINQLPEFNQTHLSSPYLYGGKDGDWVIRGGQYGTVSFFRNQQFYRYDGYLVEAEDMSLRNGERQVKWNSLLQSQELNLGEGRPSFRYTFEDLPAGNYRLLIHSRSGENSSPVVGEQGSFFVWFNSSFHSGIHKVVSQTDWSWQLLNSKAGSKKQNIIYKHSGGPLSVNLAQYEGFGIIDALLLVPEVSAIDLVQQPFTMSECWSLSGDQIQVNSGCGTSNAEWHLELNDASIFELSGITQARNGGDNSFFISSSYLPWTPWHLPVGGPRLTLFDEIESIHEPKPIYLSNSESTWFALNKREDYAVISQPKLTRSYLSDFVFTQENVSSNNGFKIVSDKLTMTGKAMEAVSGKIITYDFEVRMPGYYCLSGKVWGQNGNADSLWYRFDMDLTESLWSTGVDRTYTLKSVSHWFSQTDSERACRYLHRGMHELTLRGRETGLKIDYLHLHRQ